MGQNNRSEQENPASVTDEMLLRRCRDGQIDAFGELIEKYQHRLFNAVLRMVHNYDDAQELTQEAFVRALKGLKRFRGAAGFYTWLFRIGMNLCINFHRRRRTVQFSSLQPSGQGLGRQADGLAELLPARTPSPLQQAQLNETHQRLLQALQKLEPPARAVVVLRDIAQFDYNGIAKVLEIPVGTVKSRLARARMALREQLLEQTDEQQ